VAITHELFLLGRAARRLADGSDQLNRILSDIDRALARLMLGFEFQVPRPIAELVHHDSDGKRVIELHYLGYLRMPTVEAAADDPFAATAGGHHLAIRTIKVLEGRKAADGEPPGQLTPLLLAPLALRHAAVDHLPELVAGLAALVEDMAGQIERRTALAAAVLDHLQGHAPDERRKPGGDAT
jgi:hypothetical protein